MQNTAFSQRGIYELKKKIVYGIITNCSYFCFPTYAQGDIWAETSMLGLRWKYLALMEGKVYDITEWANCQKGALAHLEPNSHMVQYRIVRGAQQQQQQQQQKQQTHHQQQQHQQHAGSHYPGGGPASGKFKRDNIPTT